MKRVIRWAIDNAPAMNVIMIVVMLGGAACFYFMRREVFPEFELEIVLVTVPYPNATPEEVERSICQRLEESVHSIANIKKMTAVAQEGAGYLVLEIEPSAPDVKKILEEVRSEVDRIPNFPPDAREQPSIQQMTFRTPAVKIGLAGPEIEIPDDARSRQAVTLARDRAIREVAERYRDRLLEKDSISQVNIIGARPFQIDVEISQDARDKYGLTHERAAMIIRRANVEVPSGALRGRAAEVMLKGKNKRLTGEEIAKIPIMGIEGGGVLRLGDVAEVHDGFSDATLISEVNGKPGIVLSVDRTAKEDLFALTDQVHEFVEEAQATLPEGFTLTVFNDQSVDVRDRMDMLIRNGASGLILVFIVLAIFLDLKLAFWVAMGIPVSVLGSGVFLLLFGQTLNMLSMFAFLIALGIVVDDAIVIGENIYRHRQLGLSYHKAAVVGTLEVVPSVAASVTTTVIAFMPLLFVSGVMGKFIAVMPFAVIAMLLISLVESMTILPCHLAHKDQGLFTAVEILFYPIRFIGYVFQFVNNRASEGLDWFVENIYLPSLRFALNYALLSLCSAAALLFVFIGFVMGGLVPFNIFPKTDSRNMDATVVFPDGTPSSVTNNATELINDVALQMSAEYEKQHGVPLVSVTHRVVGEASEGMNGPSQQLSGSHVGKVEMQILSPEDRDISGQEVIKQWRQRTLDAARDMGAENVFAGAESVVFKAQSFGPGGKPIEFKLISRSENSENLNKAVEAVKAKLAAIPGLEDVQDDSRAGKTELYFTLQSQADSMGVSLADVSESVQSLYFGNEVQRLQRGRHQVKVMVRYPDDERRSLVTFDDIRVEAPDGSAIPKSQLADNNLGQGSSTINRINQMRSITISADIDEQIANASKIVEKLQAGEMDELLADYPGISVRWEGQAEQSQESMQSLMRGFVVALFAMYVLLVVQFRSFMQPVLILAIIPFGAIGAIAGHAIMQLDVTLFSMFGLVALTGVVINDSIVLIDFINARTRGKTESDPDDTAIQSDDPTITALLDSGRSRFRPVLLTSITTIAGLFPMLLERSFQAQILIPMATSLVFGLMLATVLVLILVPTFYYSYVRSSAFTGWLLGNATGVLLKREHEEHGSQRDTDHANEIGVDTEMEPILLDQDEPEPAEPAASETPTGAEADADDYAEVDDNEQHPIYRSPR